MLNFRNITLRRGTRILFSNATFIIHSRQKVGFTGANGAGKSSLFAMVKNELLPDAGDFNMPPNLAVAHVAQEMPAVNISALDYVIDGDIELRKLQQQIQHAELAQDGYKLAELHQKLDTIGGYGATSRAARLLDGLGFKASQIQQPVSAFSGGWRMRLNLAQALMCRSDILLLDEPTNHLDLDAVLWLQDWLQHYAGTLLLISHDRDFLDSIVDHIVHIEQGLACCYTGNYSAFERMRAEKLAQQQSAFQKQQREIAHIQSFINRFKAQATKARQAQSRIKALERMEMIVMAHVDSPFNFTFQIPQKLPNPLLTLDAAVIGYNSIPILPQVNLSIAAGDRIGLLGANGAGKSSLLKTLAGTLPLLQGKRLETDALNMGYFAQHQLEQLHADENPLWHFQQKDKQASEKELRHFLGGFDFCGDKVHEPVKLFSGGEKARLVLALIVYDNPNLLLLDEPTNHLDLEMCHALSIALQDFKGAMIVVSHDRHLLRAVTDTLLLVADGCVKPFDGDLDDYRALLAQQRRSRDTNEDSNVVINEPISRKDQRKQDAQYRQKQKPLLDALKKAEKIMDQYLHDQQMIEKQLTDETLYTVTEKARLKQLLEQKISIDKALEEAEITWLNAQEKLDMFDLAAKLQ
jgi:ATP-binding cassette subfamily F protein 3